MSTTGRPIPDLTTRRAPGWGGFNATILAIEVRRLLRNRRTLIFSIVLPVVFFLVFGLNAQYAGDAVGNGNVSAYVMISMALYGAILATPAAARWCRSNAPPAGAGSYG